MAVLDNFTPLVERISIDEAFLDVVGCTHLFGSPAEIAQQIRQRVHNELGLPISVGVARTKHLAKIASQVAKPDGLVVVDPAKELAFLHDLPVELMWGVGPVTRARLAERGITTIGELAATSPHALDRLLGPAAGEKLRRWPATAIRARSHAPSRAVGRCAIGAGPEARRERIYRPALGHLADRIGTRLRAKSQAGRTVTVRVRFADLRAVTRSISLPAPVAATASLTEIAEELVRAALADHPKEKHISLVAISVSHLQKHPRLQLEFSLGARHEERRAGTRQNWRDMRTDRAVDRIRDRFGWASIGYGSVAFGPYRSVPDEFRELAEKEL